MHGYEARLPVDILCGTPQQDNISHSEYVAKVQKRLGDVFDKGWEKTGQSQVRQKAYYDRKVHGERFNTGDLCGCGTLLSQERKDLTAESYAEPGKDRLKLSSSFLVPLTGSSTQQREGNVRWFITLIASSLVTRMSAFMRPFSQSRVEEDVDDEAPILLANEDEQSSRRDMAPDIGISGQSPEKNQVEDNMEAENTQGMSETNIADSDCSSTPVDPGQGAANPLEQRWYPLRDRKRPNWFGKFVTH